jgi:ribosomal protein S18
MKKKSSDRRPKAAAAGGGRPRRGRPKVCIFCREHADWVDYKDIGVLKRFINDRGRIRARGATGTCAQHQRDLATAIKTARELALLPYQVRNAASDVRSGRGGDRRGNASNAPGAPSAAAGDDAETQSGAAADGDLAADSGSDESADQASATPAE